MIRPAVSGDAEVISRIATESYCAAFGHSFQKPDLEFHLKTKLSKEKIEAIIEEETVLIMVHDGRLVGFVQFGAIANAPDIVPDSDRELRRLYVHPDDQSKGIGTALMAAALDHPQLRCADRIFLDVWEHNRGALEFYRRHGFEVVGERRFEVKSGAETSLDLIMVRRAPGSAKSSG